MLHALWLRRLALAKWAILMLIVLALLAIAYAATAPDR